MMIRAPDEPDVIDEIYEAARQGVSKERLRESLGGRRVYIPANPRIRKEQQDQILRELQQRRTPKEVARKTGVSLRQVYRIRRMAAL
jgi:Mor family transcriptional regulator